MAGFAWKAEDAGGERSLLKYKAATATDVDEAVKKEDIEWLDEQNLDDIRATFAVRNYVRLIAKEWNS